MTFVLAYLFILHVFNKALDVKTSIITRPVCQMTLYYRLCLLHMFLFRFRKYWFNCSFWMCKERNI